MYRSTARLVRNQGNFLKSMFGGKAEKEGAKSLTVEEQESLRKALPSIRARESSQTSASAEVVDFDADELLDSRIDTDAIRARGFMKYRYNYTPSKQVKDEVLAEASRLLKAAGENPSNVSEFEFSEGNNELKYNLLNTLGNKFKHWPNNGKLVHFENVADVVEFFSTSVKNTTSYITMARNEEKPKNIHMLENAVRFHPEDTHLHHGGVTAFPGTGGEVLSLRQKRLIRQYEPKKEWFDYEDQTFDYSKADKDMPWDPEVAKQMDRYTDKRYNLKTKQFTRIRQ